MKNKSKPQTNGDTKKWSPNESPTEVRQGAAPRPALLRAERQPGPGPGTARRASSRAEHRSCASGAAGTAPNHCGGVWGDGPAVGITPGGGAAKPALFPAGFWSKAGVCLFRGARARPAPSPPHLLPPRPPPPPLPRDWARPPPGGPRRPDPSRGGRRARLARHRNTRTPAGAAPDRAMKGDAGGRSEAAGAAGSRSAVGLRGSPPLSLAPRCRRPPRLCREGWRLPGKGRARPEARLAPRRGKGRRRPPHRPPRPSFPRGGRGRSGPCPAPRALRSPRLRGGAGPCGQQASAGHAVHGVVVDGHGGGRREPPPLGERSAGSQGLRAWGAWRERCTLAWAKSI